MKSLDKAIMTCDDYAELAINEAIKQTERRIENMERSRQELIDWFGSQAGEFISYCNNKKVSYPKIMEKMKEVNRKLKNIKIK